MKTLLLTIALSIAAGHVNASTKSLNSFESWIEAGLTGLKSEQECLDQLDTFNIGGKLTPSHVESMTDYCMDQDYGASEINDTMKRGNI